MAILTSITINDTGFIKLPSGTVSQRPVGLSTGYMRYNSDLGSNEMYNGTQWVEPTTNGTSIITNGLVLHLDAGNINSYPRENLVSYSTYNSATWSNLFPANATLTTGIDAPDGSTNAIRLTCSTSGSSLLRVNFPSFTPNGTDTYTISFFVRLISGTTSSSSQLTTDLSDSNPSGDYRPLLVTNTWVRVSFSSVPTATSKTFIDLLSDNTNNFVLDFWGVQIEKKSSVTKYVPTNGAIITTNSWFDLCSGNNAALFNGVSYSSSNGGTLVFDGTDDYATEVNSLSDAFWKGNWTASFWAKFSTIDTAVTGDKVLVHHGVDTALLTQRNGLHLVQRASKIYFGLYADDLAGNTTVTTNTWYNIVYTLNNSTYAKQIYLNGSLDNSHTGGGAYVGTGSNTRIGRNVWGNSTFFNGNIGHCSFYNRVLTSSEISYNYNALKGRFGL